MLCDACVSLVAATKLTQAFATRWQMETEDFPKRIGTFWFRFGYVWYNRYFHFAQASENGT